MEQGGEFKKDLNFGRTQKFSTLYFIGAKIGLGCLTYFMVGLIISMVYVLSDMDYFTLNGQFRTQRFFTDDGYYYSRQVVLLFGILGFIVTMFVGPIGKLSCMSMSMTLTFAYVLISIFMCLLNNSKRLRFLMRSLSIISFISHTLLCNFIFVLFDPNFFIISNKTNTSSSNDSSSAKAQTLYRIMSFVSGYFLGFPLVSFLFSKLTRSFTGPLTDKTPIDVGMDVSRLLFIISIISMVSTLLTIFQFVFDMAITGDLRNMDANWISRIVLLRKNNFAWAPFTLISYNVMKNTFRYFVNIEVLLFLWFLNPMIVSLIPYSVGTHFQFHTFSHLNKILYSIMFVMILVVFVNQDLLSNCVSIINEFNTEIFKILYTDGCIQLNDDHLRETNISTTPHPNYNYNLNCSFGYMNNINSNPKYNTYNSVNSISLPGSVLYPYSYKYSGDTRNNDEKLLSSANEITSLSRLFDYNIRNKSEENIVFILGYISPFVNNISCENNIKELLFYLPNNLNEQLLSLLYSTICQYDFDKLEKSQINISLTTNKVKDFYFAFDFPSFVFIFMLIKSCSSGSVKIDSKILQNTFKSIICDLNKLVNLLREHQTNTLSQDRDLGTSSNLQSMPLLLRYHNNIICTILSHMSAIELKIALQNCSSYFSKIILIICMTKCTRKCDCDCYKIIRMCTENIFNRCIINFKSLIGNSYFTYKFKLDLENNGNSLCLCSIIECKLVPILLWSEYYIISITLDLFSTYNRQFTKYNYSEKHTVDISRTIFFLIDLVLKLMCRLINDSSSSSSTTGQTGCGVCILCKNGKISFNVCVCKFDCKNYIFYSGIFNYISSLLEYIFEFDNETTTFTFQNISNIIGELNHNYFNVGLKGSSIILLKDCKCVCTSVEKNNCDCECTGEKSNGCCCTKPDANCCCCIICKNCKIICYAICLGCCFCCICCENTCQCHNNNQNGCNTITETTCGSGSCQCQKICQQVSAILKCSSCNSGNCCKELCQAITSNESSSSTPCSCNKICNALQTASSKCNECLKNICKKITEKFTGSCKNNKCCCKIAIKSIDLLYTLSRLVSWYYHNESKFQCLLCCCKDGKCNQQNGKKKACEFFNSVNSNFEVLLSVTKNNIISDSSYELVSRLDKYNEIDTSKNAININKNKYPSYSSLDAKYYRFTSNRFIIPICLIILALFMRQMFDNFIKINIMGHNYKIKKFQDNNMNKKMKKDLNKVMSEQFDIQGRSNMVTEINLENNNIGNDSKINNHENHRYSNTKYYVMIIIVSFLSALYSNMTIRNMYNRLNLEYNMWSYLVNMVIIIGLIFTLLSKYYIHVFDFVGVLDKYGMNLSKSDSFIDYVDRSDPDFIDHFSTPVKNMMMYGLFKSMTKDLKSLTIFKDVGKISGSATTYTKLKSKLYPFKEMSKPLRRITRHCDKCSFSFRKIKKEVLDGLGIPKESIDIVSVLDFLSYSMIFNREFFKDQYQSYFSGDETYMAWVLGKLVNNNTFLAEYYRHQTLNNIELEIKQLINGNHKLGTSNLMLIWKVFFNSEIDLISFKSVCDNMEVQMIKDQRETLKKLYYEKYLKDFYNYQKYITSKLFNVKVVSRSKSTDIKSTLEFRDILNKNILDKNKLYELTSSYFNDEYNKKLTSMSIPTITCNIKGDKEQVKTRIKEFCDDWLEHKLHFCNHMNNLECEKAVNVAYNTITSIVDKPGDLYKNIYDLLFTIDLDFFYDLKQVIGTRPTLGPRCRDCESLSMYYIGQYLSSTHTNIDKMLTPLGMYLSWHGTPIDKHHLNKCSHTQ